MQCGSCILLPGAYYIPLICSCCYIILLLIKVLERAAKCLKTDSKTVSGKTTSNSMEDEDREGEEEEDDEDVYYDYDVEDPDVDFEVNKKKE